MKKILIVSFLLFLPLNPQSKKVKRSVTSSAGVQTESSSYKINGTLGQSAIGLTGGKQIKLSSGYWGYVVRWVLGTDGENIIPNEFQINPAYPNPFNPSTRIDMEIPDAGIVQITIYDLLGRVVLDHKEEYPSGGHYQFVWNARTASGRQLATGTYIVLVRHQNNINTQKITLLK